MTASTRSVALLCASLVLAARCPAAPIQCTIDGAHTSVIFGVSHLGLSYTYGRVNKVQGQFTYDRDDPANCQFTVTMDADSVDTNNSKRDQHLKSADFFNTRQFPTIEFQGTGTEKTANGITLNGNVTMHGETKPVTIPLQLLGEGPGPGGDPRIGFICKFVLKRSDFGMTNMVGAIGDEVSVMMSFEGVIEPAQ